MARQPALAAQAAGSALRSAMDGTSDDIAKSDVLASLKDISAKVKQSRAGEGGAAGVRHAGKLVGIELLRQPFRTQDRPRARNATGLKKISLQAILAAHACTSWARGY